MRFMTFAKATEDSEAGVIPSEEMLAEMVSYIEQLVKAGVMLDDDPLKPFSEGARVHFDGEKRTIVDGPFPETKELVAGYWLWQVDSLEDAIKRAKKCPNPMKSQSVLEIRPLFEAEDFGDAITPETAEINQRLREQLSGE